MVGFGHDIHGEGIFAYVTLKENIGNVSEEKIIEELKQNVKAKISGYAVPHGILVTFEHEFFISIKNHPKFNVFNFIIKKITPNLPKTRSGKIMRRVLRKIADNKPNELGDLSTLLDPSIINIILEKYNQNYQNKK